MKFLSPLFPLAALPLVAQAHRYPHHNVIARQDPGTNQTSSAQTTSAAPNTAAPASSSVQSVPPLASVNPTALPLSMIISSAPGMPTRAVSPIYPQGAVPTGIPGAPPLPDAVVTQSDYPTPDKVPPTDSAEVAEWIKEVADSKVPIPDIPVNAPGGCGANPAAAADPNRCWWTCSQCTRKTDITQCPNAGTWGLTFDDGPAFYTPDLLSYLDEQSLKATFFVVGSRVYYEPGPDILRKQYMESHQIAVHTWSHPQLTTLTNEQVIAELGWARRIIQDVLGVTPNMMRPPYGDIDDRVRAISVAMGLTPVMWTNGFDTGDFDIASGATTVQQTLINWENIAQQASTSDKGFIVLEHDLFQQTVEVATGYILPDAIAHKFKIEPVVSCMGLTLNDAYIETNDNKTHPDPAEGAETIFTGPTKALYPSTATPSATSGPSSSPGTDASPKQKQNDAAKVATSALGMGAGAFVAGLLAILA